MSKHACSKTEGGVSALQPKDSRFSSIKALWIDVDQTLLDFDACARDALIDTFAWAGLPWKEAYFQIFLQVNAGLWDQIEEGTMTRKQLQEKRFPALFSAWNLPEETVFENGRTIAGYEGHFSGVLHESAHPLAGSKEALQRFQKQNMPLFIISNGPAAGQKRRLEKAGMLSCFLDVYTSQDFGAAKPDPAFFEHALSACSKSLKTELKPEEILVIGDSWKADITGALAFGAPSIWLRTNRQHDPFEKPEHENVLEADSWNDILHLLGMKEGSSNTCLVSGAETD